MEIKFGGDGGTDGKAAIVLLVELMELLMQKGTVDANEIRQAIINAEKRLPTLNNVRLNETRELLGKLKLTA